jgi:predicted O-methyltransferase YrrM
VPDAVNVTLRIVSISDITIPRWMTPFAEHLFAIPTHMTPQERLMLLQTALNFEPGFTAVEIGSYLGASTAFLGFAALQRNGNVHAVDPWTNAAMGAEGERDTFAEFRANTEPFKHYITTHRGVSAEIQRKQGAIECDLLFIDGDHSYGSVVTDLRCWLPSLKPGGTLAMHDFDAPTVKQAFDDVVGGALLEAPNLVERLLICRPKPLLATGVRAS